MWLAVVAIFASALALGVDELAGLITDLKFEHRDNYWIWVPGAIVLVAIAVASVQFISKEAEGSGIPQVKAILSGITLSNMLSWKTLLAKIIGLTAFMSSGMSTGKEGPFVHIASCIANNLPYKDLKKNKTIRHQMITAAIAVGVTASFGTPIGAVLFSIELSTTVYNL